MFAESVPTPSMISKSTRKSHCCFVITLRTGSVDSVVCLQDFWCSGPEEQSSTNWKSTTTIKVSNPVTSNLLTIDRCRCEFSSPVDFHVLLTVWHANGSPCLEWILIYCPPRVVQLYLWSVCRFSRFIERENLYKITFMNFGKVVTWIDACMWPQWVIILPPTVFSLSRKNINLCGCMILSKTVKASLEKLRWLIMARIFHLCIFKQCTCNNAANGAI